MADKGFRGGQKRWEGHFHPLFFGKCIVYFSILSNKGWFCLMTRTIPELIQLIKLSIFSHLLAGNNLITLCWILIYLLVTTAHILHLKKHLRGSTMMEVSKRLYYISQAWFTQSCVSWEIDSWQHNSSQLLGKMSQPESVLILYNRHVSYSIVPFTCYIVHNTSRNNCHSLLASLLYTVWEPGFIWSIYVSIA